MERHAFPSFICGKSKFSTDYPAESFSVYVKSKSHANNPLNWSIGLMQYLDGGVDGTKGCREREGHGGDRR